MTDAKIQNYIRNKLRAVQVWTDAHKQARLNAAVGNQQRCSFCLGLFERSETHVDHKVPVVAPQTGFTDWNTFIERLFCRAEGLQVLCKADHNRKTAEENALREKYGTGRFSAKARAALAGALLGNKCATGPKTATHRLHMSNERKGKPQTPARVLALNATRRRAWRGVLATCLKTGAVTSYPSIKEAAVQLGFGAPNISRVLNGKFKQIGGYAFSYAEVKNVQA